MSVHGPQQVYRFEVIDTRAPATGAERLIEAPIELEHAINVLEPYLWHVRL